MGPSAVSVGVSLGDLPLVVDMDGTLILTDSLVEGAIQLWKLDPWFPVKVLAWLLRGKAQLKDEIASRVTLDAEYLPYNQILVEHFVEQRGSSQAGALHRCGPSIWLKPWLLI